MFYSTKLNFLIAWIVYLNSTARKSNNFIGIKYQSFLNDLKYYHVVEGSPPDNMHDIPQGVTQK